MEKDSEIIDAVLKDNELAGRMEQAFSKGATSQELVDILKDAGIEVEASEVEELTAQLQTKRGESIAMQELDIDELDQVAGGGNGICDWRADCDKNFKARPETPKDDRCSYTALCDEYYGSC